MTSINSITRLRRSQWMVSPVLGCLGLIAGSPLQAAARNFDIPAQHASDAVKALAQQSGLQIAALSEDLGDIQTNAVHGVYEPVDALKQLIAGTGLEMKSTGGDAVTIRRVAAAQSVATERSTEDLDEVVVTGSRIKRAGFDTLEAATVTDSKEIERRAYTNIGQALEATPGFTPDVGPIGSSPNQDSIGQTFVNFFGLGSQRTLTLVNGRRFVSSNSSTGRTSIPAGSQVDLNLIPAGLVERVETIAIGGAPIYGSDAISGTVNIILKDNFEGIQGSAQYGVSEQGDAGNENYRLLMGGNFAENRGNAVVSVEYNEGKGLLLRDRYSITQFLANPNNTGPDDGIPALEAVDEFRFGTATEGGLPYDPAGVAPGFLGGNYIVDGSGTPLQFGPTGELIAFNPGVIKFDAGLPGTPVFTQGGDGMDPARHFSLLSPVKRTMVNGIAHYDVTPWARAFVESSFAHTEGTETSELYAYAAPFPLGGPVLSFSLDNPFLSQQARDTLAANGFSGYALNRNLSDITDSMPGQTELDLYRIVGGFEGDLQLFDEEFSWNVSYNYGRSRNTSSFTFIDPTRLANAMDAVRDPTTGAIVCASAADNPQCAPINLFGADRFSPEAADYVSDRGSAVSLNTQQVITANFAGKLPFGISTEHIAFNLGAERRKEEASFEPDAVQEAGVLLLGPGVLAARGVKGAFETKEIYSEVVAPIISTDQNFRIAKSLSLEGAVRYVDNSIAGPDTTWSTGGRFAPRLPGWGDGLLFRAVFTHAIRAPAVTELFSGATPVANQIADPCDALNVDQGLNPAVRRANCTAALAAIAAGSPDAFNPTTDSVSAFGTLSGNRNLENETADSWSAGFVFQPSAHPAFSMALDWSNISLEGGIENLGIDAQLAACYDSPNFPNEAACGSFQRLDQTGVANQPGVVRNVGDIADGYDSGYINVSGIEFAGVIAEAAYRLDLRSGSAGTLRFGTKMFYVDKFEVTANSGSPPDDRVGGVGVPKYRATFTVGYSIKNLDADLQALWRDSTVNDKTATIENTPLNNYPSYTLFNGTVGYRITSNLRAQLAVMNLLDKDIPAAARANLDLSSFDPLGRRYFATVFASF